MRLRRHFFKTFGAFIFLVIALTFLACGGSSSKNNNNPQPGANNPGSTPPGGTGSTGSSTGGSTTGGTSTGGTTGGSTGTGTASGSGTGSGTGGGTGTSGGTTGGGSTGGGGGTGSSQSQSMFIFATSGAFVQDGKIDINGQITPVVHHDERSGIDGFPTETGGSVISVAPDPRGRFLYTVDVATFSAGSQIGKPGISEYVLDRNTGELNPVQGGEVPILFGNNRRIDTQLVIEPSGTFAYTVDNSVSAGDNGIWLYSIDQSSGALSGVSGSPFGKASGSLLAVSPNGKFLFNAGNGSISSYTLSNGRPVLAGVPLPGGGDYGCCPSTYTGQLLASPNSQFVYLLDKQAHSVDVYAVAENGVLTPVAGSPFTFGDSRSRGFGMALTPDGRFLYVAMYDFLSDIRSLVGLSVAPSSGAITGQTFSSPQGNSGFLEALADFSGKFLYVKGNAGLVTYTINGDGTITQSSILSNQSTLASGTDYALGP